jgi:hypothetical protein
MSRDPFPSLRRFVRPIARLGEGALRASRTTRAAAGPGRRSPFVGVLAARQSWDGAFVDAPTMLPLTLVPVPFHERVERETRVVEGRGDSPAPVPERFGTLLRDAPAAGDAGGLTTRVLTWRTERLHTPATTRRPERSATESRGRVRAGPPALTVNRSFPTRVERSARDVRVVHHELTDAGRASGSASPTDDSGPFDTTVASSGHVSDALASWDTGRTLARPPDAQAEGPTTRLPSVGVDHAGPLTAATPGFEPRSPFSPAVPRGAGHRTDADAAAAPPLVVRPASATSRSRGNATASASTPGPAPSPDAGTVWTEGDPSTGSVAAADGVTPTPSSPSAVAGPQVVDALFAQRTTVDRLVDRLYVEFERKLRIERERRGYGRGGR